MIGHDDALPPKFFKTLARARRGRRLAQVLMLAALAVLILLVGHGWGWALLTVALFMAACEAGIRSAYVMQQALVWPRLRPVTVFDFGFEWTEAR